MKIVSVVKLPKKLPVTAPVVATTGLMPRFAARSVKQQTMRNLGITLIFMIKIRRLLNLYLLV